jgi:hypothetical protein
MNLSIALACISEITASKSNNPRHPVDLNVYRRLLQKEQKRLN